APQLLLVAPQLLAQLPHDLAAPGSRPGPPLLEGGDGRRGHPFVVGGGGHPHGGDGLARRRVQRFDALAGGLDPVAVEGARVLLPEAQGFQGLLYRAFRLYGHIVSPPSPQGYRIPPADYGPPARL